MLERKAVAISPCLVVIVIGFGGVSALLLEVSASTGINVSRANSHILDPIEGPQIVALDDPALGLGYSHVTCPS